MEAKDLVKRDFEGEWFEFKVGNKVGNKVWNKLSDLQKKIIIEMQNNPNINISKLSLNIGVSHTAIENNIKILKNSKIIKRIGSNKKGYWKVNDIFK